MKDELFNPFSAGSEYRAAHSPGVSDLGRASVANETWIPRAKVGGGAEANGA